MISIFEGQYPPNNKALFQPKQGSFGFYIYAYIYIQNLFISLPHIYKTYIFSCH